jgi:hypothetical protein
MSALTLVPDYTFNAAARGRPAGYGRISQLRFKVANHCVLCRVFSCVQRLRRAHTFLPPLARGPDRVLSRPRSGAAVSFHRTARCATFFRRVAGGALCQTGCSPKREAFRQDWIRGVCGPCATIVGTHRNARMTDCTHVFIQIAQDMPESPTYQKN